MSKCFVPLLKSDGLPYKTCDKCKCTDKKYRDKHKEQIKVYRDQHYLDNQDKIKEYREVNKDKIKERVKEYREVNKDKISTKLKLDRITCQEEIKFHNIKNLHVIKNLWKRKTN